MTLPSFSFGPTTPVAFGVDRSRKLAKDLVGLGAADKPVLLVADPGLAALAEGLARRLKGDGLAVTLFTDVRSDPLSHQVDAAAEKARWLGAGAVIGLG